MVKKWFSFLAGNLYTKIVEVRKYRLFNNCKWKTINKKTDDLDGYIYLNVDEFLNKYNHRDLIFKNRNIKIYKYYDKRSNYVAK
ncbi:hypothetical protein NW069_02855 [Mycoplasmopsis cynos]|uniref:hypothetical protein n=1 Tax=Mycoplasmopsis cynos TaxID=171284 RepID=UPI0021FC6AFB|nr:hypothetical protein [Mycoplasmopsis cynos]UWV80283.1 hypothetical protein NW069_02855 [Mycoplasmopsis cynos]